MSLSVSDSIVTDNSDHFYQKVVLNLVVFYRVMRGIISLFSRFKGGDAFDEA
jgi:hypothetical protein